MERDFSDLGTLPILDVSGGQHAVPWYGLLSLDRGLWSASSLELGRRRQRLSLCTRWRIVHLHHVEAFQTYPFVGAAVPFTGGCGQVVSSAQVAVKRKLFVINLAI